MLAALLLLGAVKVDSAKRRCDLPRISAQDLTWDDFASKWRGKPVLVTHLNLEVDAPTEPATFAKRFGAEVVQISDGRNEEGARRHRSMKLAKYLSRPTKYRFESHLSLPTIFLSDLLTPLQRQLWRSLQLPSMLQGFTARPILSVGVNGSGEDFHAHEETWLWLVHGVKDWWIADADLLPKLRGLDPCLQPVLPKVRFCTRKPGEVLFFGSQAHATCNRAKVVLGLGAQGRTDSWPPVLKAVHAGNSTELAEALARHPTDAASANGRTALHEAAVWGDTTVVRQLLSAKADVMATDGESLQPSHVAALHGHQQVLELLLRATPTHGLELPNGLLHRAVMSPWLDFGFRWQGHTSVAEFVLNLESVPGVSEPFGPEGAQPLHFAAKAGHAEAADFLLGRRAALESISKTEGFTAMHFAAAMGHMEVAKALMKKGCRQVKEKRGLLPIHLAVKANSPSLVQELMKESLPSDLAHFSAEGGRTEVLRKVLRSRPGLGRSRDARGFRPLHLAALAGHLDVLDLLVREQGLPVGDADTQGFTAVHFAAKSGHRATVRHLAAMKADLKTPRRPLRPILAERFADKSPPEPDAGLLQQVLALLDVTGDGRLALLLEEGGLKSLEERLHWLHTVDGVDTLEDAFARAVYVSKADVA
eukprot:s1387_g2.t1